MLAKIIIKGFISIFGFLAKSLIQKPRHAIRPNRIAILLWGGIGNHILFSPALYAIRNRFPNAELAICSFQHFAEELFSRTADCYLTVGENPNLRSIRRMLFLLKQYRPDAVISNAMSPTFLSSFIAYLSGARIRVGIDRYCRGCLNNVRISVGRGHEVESNGFVAELLINGPVETVLRLDHSKEDEEKANTAVREILDGYRSGARVAIQPGSGRMQAFKRWEKEKFKGLIEMLLQVGARVIIIGTEEEAEEIAYIHGAIENDNLKYLRSHLTLPQISLVLKHLDLVIANDTSLVHLAAASGVPSVVVYGPTDPIKNEPWGVSSRIVKEKISCAPCYRYTIPRCRRGFRCLRDISIMKVFNAVKEILEEKKPQVSHMDINKLLDE